MEYGEIDEVHHIRLLPEVFEKSLRSGEGIVDLRLKKGLLYALAFSMGNTI